MKMIHGYPKSPRLRYKSMFDTSLSLWGCTLPSSLDAESLRHLEREIEHPNSKLTYLQKHNTGWRRRGTARGWRIRRLCYS